jgi:hypothetical protein
MVACGIREVVNVRGEWRGEKQGGRLLKRGIKNGQRVERKRNRCGRGKMRISEGMKE